ncbi:MAG: SMC-Scp complex subunit ScpB [Cytophagales bacterium]|nr:SMC-Scp complex subunit ScpB [Cytophagales bacterium]
MDFLQNHIEALIFCSKDPVRISDIISCLEEMFGTQLPQEDVENALIQVIKKYEPEDYPFQVYHTGGGYQFLTKPAYQPSIGVLLKQHNKKRLSASTLETLSIIAYKQPISKTEMESIRGVNCDYTVQKLLEKELIEIKGKSDAIGRPLIYGTTDKFMDYFGINSLADLPQPKDLPQEEENVTVVNQPGDTTS